MELRDIKYLFSYLLAFVFFASLYLDAIPLVATVFTAFVILPLFEQFFPLDLSETNPDRDTKRESLIVFDILLYFNLVVVYGAILWSIQYLLLHQLSVGSMIALTMSLTVVFATYGINVAHELGHRSGFLPQFSARALLLPSYYMHFTDEHNYGHHVMVATREDPASARKGEMVYAFWFRSVVGTFIRAWELENKRIKRSQSSILQHKVIWFLLINLAYTGLLYIVLGGSALVIVFAGIFSFIFLETINYIEHYGIERKKLPNGRYEQVMPWHSWNSNHVLGRIVLYELTRHSDHHYKANKKYQILKNMPEAPQLPAGYPGSMLLSLVPPLWFSIMDKKLDLLPINSD